MKNTMLEFKSTRVLDGHAISIDAIKVIAIYFVMIIHVCSASLYEFSSAWMPTVIVDSVARPAVPLFIMATGALLLNKDHSIGSILVRVKRVGIALLTWSVIYLLYTEGPASFSAKWLVSIVNGPTASHLWYLYSLIGAYVFLPIFSTFYKNASPKAILFCIVIWLFAYTVIPALYLVTGFNIGVNWQFSLFGGYLLLGAFIYEHRQSAYLKSLALIFAWLLSVGLTAYLTYVISISAHQTKEVFFVPSSPTAAVGAVAIFALACKFQSKLANLPTTLLKIIHFFSRTSFGVYLMHILLLIFIQSKGINSTSISPWVGIPLLSFFLMLSCSAAVAVMQKLPYVKRVVS